MLSRIGPWYTFVEYLGDFSAPQWRSGLWGIKVTQAFRIFSIHERFTEKAKP